jgi:two-component system sensor histidine kinase KdpD
VGILALRDLRFDRTDADLLTTFANQAALAIERSQLRGQALRSQLLEEVDRLRRALLGAVSHDLRTPLATMKVASSTLLDEEAELSAPNRRELYGLIDSQTDRLTRMVTGLLDMTRAQSGALVLHPEPCATGELAEDALAGLLPSLGDRSVEIAMPADLPKVLADRALVSQVLINLVENADRHSPEGTVITIRGEAVGPTEVHVSVEDCGPGVPPGDRELVFESFLRSSSDSRTGLGLWICKTFIEAHGGRIWVEDAGTGGARFLFTLEAA